MMRALLSRKPDEAKWVTRTRTVGVVLATVVASITVWTKLVVPAVVVVADAVVAPLRAADFANAEAIRNNATQDIHRAELQAARDSLVYQEVHALNGRVDLVIALLRRDIGVSRP